MKDPLGVSHRLVLRDCPTRLSHPSCGHGLSGRLVKDAHKVPSPLLDNFSIHHLDCFDGLEVTLIEELDMSNLEKVRSGVIALLCGIAICIFMKWGNLSALHLAQSLLGAANIGISQAEKRIERCNKE